MLTSIMETLKAYELFGPIATLLTGVLAILSVILNTRGLEKNLKKQITNQSEENRKKLLADVTLSSYREKRVKIELLIHELHEYSILAEQCYSNATRVTTDYEADMKEFLKGLSSLREQYKHCTQYLSKARILASSYSDTLIDEFDRIYEQQQVIEEHFHKLYDIQLDQSTDENLEPEFKKMKRVINSNKLVSSYREASVAIKTIDEVLSQIETKLIAEIRTSRKQEIELDATVSK